MEFEGLYRYIQVSGSFIFRSMWFISPGAFSTSVYTGRQASYSRRGRVAFLRYVSHYQLPVLFG